MRKIVITLYLAMITLTGIAQNPLSFHAKAGIGTSCFYGKHSSSETRIAYKTGIGAEYVLNPTWVLQSALEFVSIGGKDEIEYVGKATMNELYLQLPVMVATRLNLGKDYHASLSFGPYIACGVGGKTSGEVEYGYDSHYSEAYRFRIDTFGSMAHNNMGNKRFDAGVNIGLSFEYHKFIIGAEAQVGLVKINKQLNQMITSTEHGNYLPKNFASFFTVGYRVYK